MENSLWKINVLSPLSPLSPTLSLSHSQSPSHPFTQVNVKSFRAMKSDSIVKHVIVRLFDLLEQPVIDLAHGDRCGHRRTILLCEVVRGQAIVVTRALTFELHEFDELVVNNSF